MQKSNNKKNSQMNSHNISKTQFIHSESFILEICKFLELYSNEPQLFEKFIVPKHTIKETSVSYRTINHWEQLGLVDNSRNQNLSGWRKFSFIDLVLLSIIAELRKIGLSIEKIKKVKSCLDQKIKHAPSEMNNSDLSWLQYSFYRAVLLKNSGNTYLLVFTDGRAVITSYNDISLNKAMYLLPETCITINLNRLFGNKFKSSKIAEKNENTYELSEAEKNILLHIRTTEADAINLRFKKGNISIIEKIFEGKKDDFKSLHELIDGIKYGEANIKIQDGKVTYIQAVDAEKVEK